MLADLAGLVLLVAALAVLVVVRRLRGQVRRAGWLLARTCAAVAEARRASVMVGGSQVLDYLLGGVARNGEPDPDAAG